MCEQPREGFVARDEPGVPHQLVEKPRIQQVQNGVFDATHILVDGQPIIRLSAIDHALRKLGARKASVIPGGLNKGIEGVRLTLAGLTLELKLTPIPVCFDRRRHTIHGYLFG